ncbi:hypothetical protein AC1031_018529 [Aphanomyces cochlioides]|nr:hypothetical protein AC1031_018529 [Aphanomyces cochlioides]
MGGDRDGGPMHGPAASMAGPSLNPNPLNEAQAHDSLLHRASVSIHHVATMLRQSSSGSTRVMLRHQESSSRSIEGSTRIGLRHQDSNTRSTEGSSRMGLRRQDSSSRSIEGSMRTRGFIDRRVVSVKPLTEETTHQVSSDESTSKETHSKVPIMLADLAEKPPSFLHRASMSMKNVVGLLQRQNTTSLHTERSMKLSPHHGPHSQGGADASSKDKRDSVIRHAGASIMNRIHAATAKPRVVPFAPEVIHHSAAAMSSLPSTSWRRQSVSRPLFGRSQSVFGTFGSKLMSRLLPQSDPRRLSTASSVKRHERVLDHYHLRSKKVFNIAVAADTTKRRFLISPDSKVYKCWQLILVAIIYYQVVAIPYVLAFTTSDTNPLDDSVSLVTSAIFLLDIVLNFFTAIADPEKGLITNRREIAIRYLRGWFLLDIISAIPIDAIVYLSSGLNSNNVKFIGVFKTTRLPRLARILSLARILQFLRVPHEWRHWLLYSRYAHLIRLCAIVTAFAYMIHLMSCVWYGAVAGPMWLAWIETNYKSPSRSIHSTYMLSFYSMLTTTMGQSNTLYTNAEYVFSCCVMIQGCLLMAVVFGDVGDLISNYYEDVNNYRQKMESLLASMNLMHLPTTLQSRINEYYETMYDRYGTLNGDTVLFTNELSKNLSNEVELYLRMGMITRSPMFRLCSAEFVQEIVMKLAFQVYLTDDYVVARGEIGYEMYFLQSGTCDVLRYLTESPSGSQLRRRKRQRHHDKTSVIRTLVEGDYFGEIALLMNCKQTVTVKASSFTELCVLSRDVYREVTEKYVDDFKVIERFIMEKYDPHVLEAAMQMQVDPAKERQRAIVDCLHELDERLGILEVKLVQMENSDHSPPSFMDTAEQHMR